MTLLFPWASGDRSPVDETCPSSRGGGALYHSAITLFSLRIMESLYCKDSSRSCAHCSLPEKSLQWRGLPKTPKKIKGLTTGRNCLTFSQGQFSCRPIKWLGSVLFYYFNFPNAREGGLKTHSLSSVLIKTTCKAEFNMQSSPQICWCHFLTT